MGTFTVVLQATWRLALSWVRWSLADLGLIPGQSMFDLWCINWHLDSLSPSFIPPIPHTHLSICNE
jgi:hypothetical protein